MADLVLGIGWVSWSNTDPHRLISWTLGMVLVTNILAALGSSSWVSWMAAGSQGAVFLAFVVLVATTLLSVPLLGFAVSVWPSEQCRGYGVVLFLES